MAPSSAATRAAPSSSTAGRVREDLAPVGDYARLLASVGINGCNVNNVNMPRRFSTAGMLEGIARIADAMRPWGVRLSFQRRSLQPAKGRRPPHLRSARPHGHRVVADQGRRDLRAHSGLRRLHRQGRLRRPRGPASTAAPLPMPPTCSPPPSRRMAESSSTAASSTTIISTGTTPRPTAPAPPTTSSIPSTASSRPTSSSKPRKAPSTSRCASPSRRCSLG